MWQTSRLIALGGALAATLLHLPAYAQAGPPAVTAKVVSQAMPDDVAATADCPPPVEAKIAKVIDFDAGSSTARLAVNLGAGRFKLVTIRAWAREGEHRPLAPIIEAAQIMQGSLQFYSPKLSADPASAPSEFLIMSDMGGGNVCWATPASLLSGGAYPVAR